MRLGSRLWNPGLEQESKNVGAIPTAQVRTPSRLPTMVVGGGWGEHVAAAAVVMRPT